ncbi:PREDICTED: uncharacterized protein LOC109152245 [Ipomoea nil]|uniref:uncharacterized protein LOC109152245 n=1 Tax=Ipomoea nil TaxID=35883 RepID=UPI0009009A0B|nr:PREDICTED: uncharacterized protein LOC109152245 [Ipomoea nil]
MQLNQLVGYPNVTDVRRILSIPISVRPRQDSWVWHWDSKGMYTVKSCYRLLQGEFNTQRPWSSIWSLEIPPKCPTVNAMWSKVGVPVVAHERMGILLIGWKDAKESAHVFHSLPNTGSNVQWTKPSPGRVKVNTDAAFDYANNCMGMGWVLRNEEGRFLAAKGLNVRGCFNVNEAEAYAIQKALSWLKDLGLGEVDVETDSQVVFHAIHATSFNSSFGSLVDDIKMVTTMLSNVVFYSVKRSANRAAHLVPREAVSESGCGEWVDFPPPFLVDCLTVESMN